MATLTNLEDGRYHWRCEIPDYWPKGKNQENRSHWSPSINESKHAYSLVMVHGGRGLSGLPAFASPVRMSMTRVMGKGQRKLDPTNLSASIKTLEDVLQRPKKKWHRQYKRYVPQRFRHGVTIDDREEDYVDGAVVVEQRRSENGQAMCIIEIIGELRDRGLDPEPWNETE